MCTWFDPVTGEIRFGGGGRARVPPKGSKITATYRYVAGGAAGECRRRQGRRPQPAHCRCHGVTNPLAAAGGPDEEPIEEALRRAPGLLKTRDRAITAEDYEYLAREASPEVRIVRCLEPQPLQCRRKQYRRPGPFAGHGQRHHRARPGLEVPTTAAERSRN